MQPVTQQGMIFDSSVFDSVGSGAKMTVFKSRLWHLVAVWASSYTLSQFFHLENGANSIIYLIELVSGLNEIIYV